MPPSRRKFVRSSLTVAGLAAAGCLDRGESPGESPTTTTPPGTDGSPTATPGTPDVTPTGPDRYTARRAGPGPLAVAAGETAYVATGASLRALSLADGTVTWSRSPGSTGALVVAGGTLYTLGEDGTVRRHADDGRAAWSATIDSEGVSLAIVDAAVVALGGDGTVAAFESAEGTDRWRDAVDGVPVGLATDGTRAYVTTDADRPASEAWLTALDAADGVEAWRAHPGNRVGAAPAMLGDRVLVGTTYAGHEAGEPTPTPPPTDSAVAGYVVAYGTDGTERWTSRRLGGRIGWVAEADGRALVGYGGFDFESLDTVAKTAALTAGGGRAWLTKRVRSIEAAAVTRGLALYVDPDRPGQAALRVASGDAGWSADVGADSAAAAGRDFVTVEADAVRARSALTGAVRWVTDR